MNDYIYFGNLIRFIDDEIQQYKENFDINYEITNSCIIFNIIPRSSSILTSSSKRIVISHNSYQNIDEIQKNIHKSLYFLKK